MLGVIKYSLTKESFSFKIISVYYNFDDAKLMAHEMACSDLGSGVSLSIKDSKIDMEILVQYSKEEKCYAVINIPEPEYKSLILQML